MIPAAKPATVHEVVAGHQLRVSVDRRSLLLSRLALAVLLAAFSALIPGEADRFLETQCDWSDLWPTQWRSLAGMRP